MIVGALFAFYKKTKESMDILVGKGVDPVSALIVAVYIAVRHYFLVYLLRWRLAFLGPWSDSLVILVLGVVRFLSVWAFAGGFWSGCAESFKVLLNGYGKDFIGFLTLARSESVMMMYKAFFWILCFQEERAEELVREWWRVLVEARIGACRRYIRAVKKWIFKKRTIRRRRAIPVVTLTEEDYQPIASRLRSGMR